MDLAPLHHFVVAVIEGGAGELLAGMVIAFGGKAIEVHHTHKRRRHAALKGAATKRAKKAAAQAAANKEVGA